MWKNGESTVEYVFLTGEQPPASPQRSKAAELDNNTAAAGGLKRWLH